MSHQIIKQPDGKYAIWSIVIDDFILLDVCGDDVVKHFQEQAIQGIADEVKRICYDLTKNEKPYGQSTMTWDEAVAEQKERRDWEKRNK